MTWSSSLRRLGADVGGEEDALDLVAQLGADARAAAEQARELGDEAAAGAREALDVALLLGGAGELLRGERPDRSLGGRRSGASGPGARALPASPAGNSGRRLGRREGASARVDDAAGDEEGAEDGEEQVDLGRGHRRLPLQR